MGGLVGAGGAAAGRAAERRGRRKQWWGGLPEGMWTWLDVPVENVASVALRNRAEGVPYDDRDLRQGHAERVRRPRAQGVSASSRDCGS